MRTTSAQIKSRKARALQLYLILIGAAQAKRTLTYQELGEMAGVPHAGIWSQTLNRLKTWCDDNDLPSITTIVVQKNSGLPGAGLKGIFDLSQEQKQVFDFNWYLIIPHDLDDLYLERKLAPSLSEAI